jgi:molybdenum cofactor cytidylyltransferase
MSSSLTVSAIILAAGSSSRMGSPKQLLRLGSKTLLEHTLESVQASQVREIVVVLGAAADAIRTQVQPADNLRVVVNDAFQTGMGGSLQRGLAEFDSQSSATLVVLADQPLVTPATLNRLIADYLQHKPQILIPLYRGFRGNPVLLDRSVFPEMAALNGDTGCRAIFGDHLENIRKVEVDDPGILLDADKPQDLDRLRQIYAHGSFEIPLLETTPANLEQKPELVLVGHEGVAAALAKFARLVDFRVTVVDPLLSFADMPEASAILRAMDFAQLPAADRRFCVVASMGRFDEEALEQAVGANIPYIALVANKKRSQEVLNGLELNGLTTEQLGRVRTKPGLFIGAQTPAEIALSIMAEIVSQVRQA